MKIKYLLAALVLCIQTNAISADFMMMNLYSPTSLKPGYLNFSVRHRFYGDITEEPLKNFFGMDAGANIRLGLRYQPLRNFEISTSYTRSRKEKTVGISYTLLWVTFPILTRLNAEYFSYEDIGLKEETRSSFAGYIAIQNRPVLERIVGTLNIGYDGYHERFVSGVGMAIVLLRDMGVFEQISLVGEYYPVMDRENSEDSYIGPEDGFAFGIKMDTYGHRFLILLTNTDELHLRRVSLGVPEQAHWRIGFNIERRIKL
jgi:hypothetical protein